jgi:nitronate monooxygenase
MNDPRRRSAEFCDRFGLKMPILLAPMAGACPPSLSVAVMRAGGMRAYGALLMNPEEIQSWVDEVRGEVDGAFQLNLWIPDPPPVRDRGHEAHVREFLSRCGPRVPEDAAEIKLLDFDARCEALLRARPTAVSSIMGLYPPGFVSELKGARIDWFATATTATEAKQAEAAGADAIIAQGMEAGGRRGAFDAAKAEQELVGLLALAETLPEQTLVSRAFSGRPGRSIATDYAKAALAPDAPDPAPYPIQRGLTNSMRLDTQQRGDLQRMQAWAGQSAALARNEPAMAVAERIWNEARELMR